MKIEKTEFFDPFVIMDTEKGSQSLYNESVKCG